MQYFGEYEEEYERAAGPFEVRIFLEVRSGISWEVLHGGFLTILKEFP
jgi:hypothetical protein